MDLSSVAQFPYSVMIFETGNLRNLNSLCPPGYEEATPSFLWQGMKEETRMSPEQPSSLMVCFLPV